MISTLTRRSVKLLGVLVMLAVFGAAESRSELPEVSALPSRPELPDPLIMLNGERVTSREQWINKRRPELKALFQHYMYGQIPPPPGKIEAKVAWESAKAFDGKATLKEITITFGPSEMPEIHLLTAVPNKRKGPVPVFVGMNFCGNHTLVKDAGVGLPTAWLPKTCPGCKDNRATDAGRGAQVDVWSLEQSIERGYAVATFYCGDIDPDRPDVRLGVQPQFEKTGKVKPGPHAWGTIAAWAWGVHRAVDYLVTDKAIDRNKIAVVGHSRLGKTALVAAAFDERIALAIPHQAGCGGTAPSRGTVGESVKQINDHFPHWFCGAFKEFNEQTERLPFDQHCLVALVAPRPVLFSNATDDTWANPAGQFQVLQAADPVYRLLGAGGLDAKTMPQPGTLIDSRLGYFIRPGKHSMTREDWQVFMDYAGKQFGK
jgi:hypothetical protein